MPARPARRQTGRSRWLGSLVERIPRRIGGRPTDLIVLAVGGVVLVVGSVLPWLRGATRLSGTLDWTGLHDTGEGAMFLFAVVAIALWARLREPLGELAPRTRFVPLAIAVTCGLLWVIAMRKALYLSWWEIEAGARPQIGLLMSAIGILVTGVGGVLAATDPGALVGARGQAARVELERRRRAARDATGPADEFVVRGPVGSGAAAVVRDGRDSSPGIRSGSGPPDGSDGSEEPGRAS